MPVDMPTLERNAEVAAEQWGQKNLYGKREQYGYKAAYIDVTKAFVAAKDAADAAAQVSSDPDEPVEETGLVVEKGRGKKKGK